MRPFPRIRRPRSRSAVAATVLASLALAAPALADAGNVVPGQYIVGKAGQAMPTVVDTTAAGAAALRKQAGVRYVEPNYVIHAAQDSDPLFDQQWALAQADSLDAQDAWIQSQGAGVAPQAKIMAVKVLDSNLAGTAAGLAQGIQYAVAHGAKIINASVNGDGQSQALENAIQQARAAGVILVASAGNDSRNLDSQP